MAYTFDVHPEAVKQRFSVYVVIARGADETRLYVGKTGDNREGCNPLISRCGNHFSYNKIHSQIRNKLLAHESWRYTYVFDHFDEYCDDERLRRERIEQINEMERWLNCEVQKIAAEYEGVKVENGYRGRGYCNRDERKKRSEFRTAAAEHKIRGILNGLKRQLGVPNAATERPTFEGAEPMCADRAVDADGA